MTCFKYGNASHTWNKILSKLSKLQLFLCVRVVFSLSFGLFLWTLYAYTHHISKLEHSYWHIPTVYSRYSDSRILSFYLSIFFSFGNSVSIAAIRRDFRIRRIVFWAKLWRCPTVFFALPIWFVAKFWLNCDFAVKSLRKSIFSSQNLHFRVLRTAFSLAKRKTTGNFELKIQIFEKIKICLFNRPSPSTDWRNL